MTSAGLPARPMDVGARARWVLLASIGVTAVLYLVPYGWYAAYPLLLISTAVHELGHGVAAWLVGGSFHQFVMHPDASGVALTSVRSPLGAAVMAAGGLVGPAFGAGLGFVAARRPRSARIFLAVVGVFLILMALLVVRNAFGLFFVGALAAACLFFALVGSAQLAQLVLVFLSVQLALSVFSRGDYLFTDYAQTASGRLPSDVQVMSDALFGPYWFWGAVCGAISIVILAAGSLYLIRGTSRRPRARARAR
jgi:hypothetical protein